MDAPGEAGLGELSVDALECVADLLAQDRHHHDDDRGDQGHEETVLDRRRATILTSPLPEPCPPSLYLGVEVEQQTYTPFQHVPGTKETICRRFRSLAKKLLFWTAVAGRRLSVSWSRNN